MIAMTLQQSAEAVSGRLAGVDAPFQGVSTDTRSLAGGNLYVALRGERFDGHEFIAQARKRGAVAALVDRDCADPLAQVRVSDTRLGLGRLASAWRRLQPARVVGVTGSNGKTTVKHLLARILSHSGPVLATEGNFNNDVGVPLTLFRLHEHHRFAVVEMGANHRGEIAYLARIAQPHVAVITNAGPAHLEGFGGIDGVIEGKGELYRELAADGVAVLNADDAAAERWQAMIGDRRCVRFALEADAEVRGRWQAEGQGGRLHLTSPAGETDIELALPGRHNAANALAAAAAALAAGADLTAVRAGLSGARPVARRSHWRQGPSGMQILDDTYNANPASLAAALTLVNTQPGQRWLVLGDMLELGGEARALHATAGTQARAAGIQRLYGLGPLSAAAVEAFGEGGRHFADAGELSAALLHDWPGAGAVVVKGSRGMHLERVIDRLLSSASDARRADGGSD